MKLFSQKIGSGPSLIILHGLYGSSDNWVTIAKQIADKYTVYLVDQRNHGRSPHDNAHSYQLMCADLLEFITDNNIEKTILIGHSMGGKTALLFAALYPERLSGLIIVDIAPAGYASLNEYSPQALQHLNIIHAMLEMDFGMHKSRTEIEKTLEKSIKDTSIRQFIMKNVHREKDGQYRWKLNVNALSKALPEIMGPIHLEKILKGKQIIEFPILFIRGGKSNYLLPSHYPEIKEYIPNALIETILNAGHWVHAEQPEEFLKTINQFLDKSLIKNL
jgi:pimeloyl-ACP methyl ester carboxylesterase